MKRYSPPLLFLLVSSLVMVSNLAIAKDKGATPGYNHKIPEKIMTPDKIRTRLGILEFYDGVPTESTLTKVYDHLDFMRGVEVFLNFVPATSLEAIRLSFEEINSTKPNEVVIFDDLMDSSSLFLTGNTDTVYAMSIMDLERDGPTVVEIPAGAGPGTVNDAFFRFVVDMGAPGPDAQKGGIYIILPPDYTGPLMPTKNGMADRGKDTRADVMVGNKSQKAWIAKSESYVNWLILRGFLVDGKPDTASNMWRNGLKIYPLKDANKPAPMRFTNATGKAYNTIHANNIEFYEELSHVIQKEPISFIDPELRGLAAAIGIEKGKPFKPDERMQRILKGAVAVGNATARSIAFSARDEAAYYYKDKRWFTAFIGGDYRWLKNGGIGGRNLDARTLFFYIATVNTPAMALQISGVGSNYALAAKDSKDRILYGDKSYQLTLPANIPAKDFWSVVVYDPQTRSELQIPGGTLYPSKNSQKDKLVYNKDGSITLYFGPNPPSGKPIENWIETVPDKAWFTVLRLYGPLEPWFDKTWQPSDIERM